MSHSIGNHISTQTALAASGTVKTQIVSPRTDGPISTGVASDQSAALAVNRSATGASTATTLTDSIATPWTASAYIGHIVNIIAGTCSGQSRLITANTNQVLTVDVAFTGGPPDATTRFEIKAPSRSAVVVKGWTLDNTATAGTIRLESKGLLNGVMTTRTLFGVIVAAAPAFDTKSGYSFVGLPGTDIRASPSAAMAGTVTMDAYYVHEYTTGVIDD